MNSWPFFSRSHTPAIEKSRYYSVQLTDMYAFNYGYVGSRTTGNVVAT